MIAPLFALAVHAAVPRCGYERAIYHLVDNADFTLRVVRVPGLPRVDEAQTAVELRSTTAGKSLWFVTSMGQSAQVSLVPVDGDPRKAGSSRASTAALSYTVGFYAWNLTGANGEAMADLAHAAAPYLAIPGLDDDWNYSIERGSMPGTMFRLSCRAR